MSNVKFEGNILKCPICNGGNLHHNAVEVYVRPKEDAEIGLKLNISEKDYLVIDEKSPMTANPSRRRNGLRIKFWCENDQTHSPSLRISQHKGCTFINWEEPIK